MNEMHKRDDCAALILQEWGTGRVHVPAVFSGNLTFGQTIPNADGLWDRPR